MELSEEQTDPVMGNMDKSQRNEKILNLTLEIIYLLSGEDFAVMKKSGDGVPQRCTDCMLEGFCRRHTPTVSQTSSAAIQKENDKIVLELISNIIQLLTGEEWGYIKGNKALYREEIMENFQQLCTKDGDYGEPTGTAAHLQATLCSRVGSSETVGRGGCLTNTPTPEHPTPEITIKEEPPSWEEEEEENYYCINAQWQGAAPSPAMARSANVIATSVKEEPISYEEEGSHSAAVTEQTPTVTPSPVSTTREKPSSCKRRNQSDCSINPLREHIRGTDTPTPITGCRPNTGTAPHYISDANKDKLASHCSSKAPKEQIQGADTPTPIMGNSLDNR
ncbi:oocyte zinc finger protein XlCOF29-like [Xenopus tropicalis]|nr:oocyte zinc finger protein XlCOF29-like [Xenopus tropicalis]CAJ82184.1 novel protein [Xenopus tropicalis]|eukprot:NP_001037941.1 oocyte zinc finger protein XlCOF29-like [Xenopus tropicalis]